MAPLHGRTVLVTGSTDGVGRLVARRLGAAGARVLVHGRNPERGAGVVAAIRESGGTAEFLAADLASLAEVDAPADLEASWRDHSWPNVRTPRTLLATLPTGAFPGVDTTDVYEFLEAHAPR